MLLCFALAVGRAGRARRADGRQAQHSRPNGGVAVVSGLGVYARGGRGLLGCLALGRNDGIVLLISLVSASSAKYLPQPSQYQ